MTERPEHLLAIPTDPDSICVALQGSLYLEGREVPPEHIHEIVQDLCNRTSNPVTISTLAINTLIQRFPRKTVYANPDSTLVWKRYHEEETNPFSRATRFLVTSVRGLRLPLLPRPSPETNSSSSNPT